MVGLNLHEIVGHGTSNRLGEVAMQARVREKMEVGLQAVGVETMEKQTCWALI